jgi:uncharacterized lipoprotein
VEIRYGAPAAAAAVQGASRVGVAVAAMDARATNRDRISVKKNGYGMEMARIVAANDVVAEVERGVAAELAARGFRTDGADARLELEVLRIYNDFKVGFWSGSAEGEAMLNARVLSRDGQVVYAKTYTARFVNQPIMVMLGDNARLAIEGAIRQLVQDMMRDQALMAALASQAPTQPATVPAPTRRGRPTS